MTSPLLQRLHTQVKRRGFAHVAGRVIPTFSGDADDPREVFAIPEARSSWQRLDQQLPALPSLLAYLPGLRFNGPGLHLLLLDEIDTIIPHPAAGRTYHLDELAVSRLLDQFRRGASAQR